MRPLADVARLVRGASRSRRVHMALSTGALSSLGNFSVSLALARQLSLGEYGIFALAFALYALSIGAVRSGLVEPALAVGARGAGPLTAMPRASLAGLAAAVLLAIAGAIASSPYLVIIGLGVHGAVIYEFLRVVDLAVDDPRAAQLREITWLVPSVASGALTFFGVLPAPAAVAVWIGTCSSIAYVSALRRGISLRPGVQADGIPLRVCGGFAADYLIGSGSAQVTTALLTGFGGSQIVGALRAAGTLLGPVNVLMGTARTLVIPYLARAKFEQGGISRSALTLTIASLSVGAPFLVALALMPDAIGTWLLGANWDAATVVLPWLLIEATFSIVATAALAGHRVYLAARRTVILRSFLAATRIGVVVTAAALAGAEAAAIAMAAVALLSASVWWASLLIKDRRAQSRPA